MNTRRALFPLVLHACTWITGAEIDAKLGELDADGDGVADALDCAPDRATEGDDPERPYDGLDNDCVGGDLLDVDGDGWPGVDRATWEARRDAAGGVGAWPSWMPDEVDCDDQRPEVRPNAVEVFYDGTRTRCATAHDFDADGDGFIALAWAGTEELAAYQSSDPFAAGAPGDCDDAAPDVHPGASDAPYDGQDADCDGRSDFDFDADGYVPDHAWADWLAWEADHPGALPAAAPGDCLDIDAFVTGAARVDASAGCPGPVLREDGAVLGAAVHPGACEALADGVDADCAGDDDFDLDGDGFYGPAVEAARATYLAAWGASPTTEPGDCEEDDGSVHPSATEGWDDGVDQDCSGGPFGDLLPTLRWRAEQLSGGDGIAAGPGTALVTVEAATGPAGWLQRTPALLALRGMMEPPTARALTAPGPLRALTDGAALLTLTAPAGDEDSQLTSWRADAFGWTAVTTLEVPQPGAVSAVDLYLAPDGRRWWLAAGEEGWTVTTSAPGAPTATRTTRLAVDDPTCPAGACATGLAAALLPDAAGLRAVACAEDRCQSATLGLSLDGTPTLTATTDLPWVARGLRRTDGVDARAKLGASRDGALLYGDAFAGLALATATLSAPLRAVAGTTRSGAIVAVGVTIDGAGEHLMLLQVDPVRANVSELPWLDLAPGAGAAADLYDDGATLTVVVRTADAVGLATLRW